jgi:DNA-binding response OmpR family regulator
MATIFWVEDQSHWIDKFCSVLTEFDFGDGASSNSLDIYRFAEAACQAINRMEAAPDIAILDANMAGNDHAGFTVSRALKKKWPELPIIYLSEHSGTGIEQQVFEQAMAQDFIAKHQNNIEAVLCWRIKAALRDRLIQSNNKLSRADEVIKRGPLTIDLTNWHVYWYGERLMNPTNVMRPLAPTPRKILRVLVERSPRPVNTEQMAESLNMDSLSYASYRQHIKTLRHSFEQAAKAKNKASFLELCRQELGIVTFGDEHAYCWKDVD